MDTPPRPLPTWLPADARLVLLYGGSFDPVHNAHVSQAHLAMEAIGADLVLYMPAGSPPHKPNARLAPARDRVAMLHLALDPHPWARVLTNEVVRAEQPDARPSYTVETIEQLHEQLPTHVRLRLLIGGDMLRMFHKWYRHERIMALAEPVVMVRPPDTREALLQNLPLGFSKAEWGPRIVPVPGVAMSSTNVRERLEAGRPINDLVPPPVEAYIRTHGLYGAGRP